jgi:methyl-accepting chemotaxis protein
MTAKKPPKPMQRDMDAHAYGVDLVQEKINKPNLGNLSVLFEKQISEVLSARADVVRKILIKRDGKGDITQAAPVESSKLQEEVDTLAGMIGAMMSAFIELRRQNAEIASALATAAATVEALAKNQAAPPPVEE